MRHGSSIDPPNRFEALHRERDWEHLEWDEEYRQDVANRRIDYIFDKSKSIIAENNSPDIPFRFSLNPYRGCIHGCAYCYARNTHEYLGYNAGLDFETKIVVKPEAPQLFRKFLLRKAWQPEWISISGVTDCYQPAEREFRLTRQCLEVAWEFRQPVGLVTKNALVLRDLDLLAQLAEWNLVHVFLSVTTLRPELARIMEPRTSIPEARLRAIRALSEAKIPVGAMVAPIIPGLTDAEIPSILKAVKEAGAQVAGHVLLRLPLTVEPVFREWLQRTHPQEQTKIEGRLQQARRGKLYDAEWGERMRGTGETAEQIGRLFRVFAHKFGLEGPLSPLETKHFRRPAPATRQRTLFD